MRGKVRVTRSLSTLTLACQIQRSVFAQYRFPFDLRRGLNYVGYVVLTSRYDGLLKVRHYCLTVGARRQLAKTGRKGFRERGGGITLARKKDMRLMARQLRRKKRVGNLVDPLSRFAFPQVKETDFPMLLVSRLLHALPITLVRHDGGARQDKKEDPPARFVRPAAPSKY